MNEFLAIVLGFVFTTIGGGWWASHLQRRSWDHQNDLRLQEAERERAAEVCRELSQLLDKRLYRMRRLFWAIQHHMSGLGTEEDLAARLADYNAVLYEWNDRLNISLALIGTYFGDAARAHLDQSYERYRAVGAALEAAVQQARDGAEGVSTMLDRLDPEFEGWKADSLNARNYLLGVAMMAQLREGLVGRNAPGKLAIPSLDESG